MLSKNKIKLIHSLEQKKYRIKEGLFVAEGPKLVNELLKSLSCACLFHTANYQLPENVFHVAEIEECTMDELQKASFLTTPQDVIALFHLPKDDGQQILAYPNAELCLALDGVQDPGNLGTICRIADWFGIKHIYCSLKTADVYSPKTIQATMGAIARVKLHYTDLEALIHQLDPGTPVYGTLLDGKNLYEQELQNKGLLIMGNEGNGVTPEIRQLISQSLFIPSYPADCETSESLNVGVATAILCAEFRRRIQ